ncbi:MAG: hypothetical protein IKE76_04435 [Clostridia bacterium]|nr:hypothetical protein [Clostridia bacterium]
MDNLEQVMKELEPAVAGCWVRCDHRQPGKPGDYYVIRRDRGKKLRTDTLRFNGGYWITAGHNPTNAVEAWWEEAIF